MPIVSVIIPCYQSERYLANCLDSVLRQSLTDLEVLCVDDGSTDGTGALLRQRAAADARLKIITLPANGGLSRARNAGLAAATGEFLYFLDSDDCLLDGVLEAMAADAQARGLDFVFAAAHAVAETPEYAEDAAAKDRYYSFKGSYPDVLPGPQLAEALLRGEDFHINVSLYLTRRALLQRIGLTFIPGILHEDNPFTFRLICQAERAGVLPLVVQNHLVHSGSLVTGTSGLQKFCGMFRGYLALREFTAAHQALLADCPLALRYPAALKNKAAAAAAALGLPEAPPPAGLTDAEGFAYLTDIAPLLHRQRRMEGESAKAARSIEKLTAQHEKDEEALQAATEAAAAAQEKLKQRNRTLAKARSQLDAKNARIERLLADKEALRAQSRALLATPDYRCGHALLALPRGIRAALRRLIALPGRAAAKRRAQKEARLQTRYRCPCCDTRFAEFIDFPYQKRPERYHAALYTDTYHATLCPNCKSLPRHRIICDYLDHHREQLAQKDVLAFAIEKGIAQWFNRAGISFTSADLFLKADLKLDIQAIELPDACEDFVLCNHVLEHVPDYHSALRELFRILRPGGVLMISVPTLYCYDVPYEDPAITDEAGRREHFGQVDHLRIFGSGFRKELEGAGFRVSVIDGGRCPAELHAVVGPATYDDNHIYLCTKP